MVTVNITFLYTVSYNHVLSLLTSKIIKKKRLLSTQLQGNTAEIKVADRNGISHYIIKILLQDIIKLFSGQSSHKLIKMRYLQP
jgi:hypothetical protein